jgi:hypothetical protein
MSRVRDVGIMFATYDTDTAIDSFQTAAIYDKSGSNYVLKVDGAHAGGIIDLSGISSMGRFIRGDSNADTSLVIDNGVDYSVSMTIDSGTSAAQNSGLVLSDRGTGKWSVIKGTGNNFNIQNIALATTPFAISGSTDTVSLAGDLDVAGDSIRLRTSRTPSSASDTGSAGEIAWDTSYIYICTASNTWKRVAIATW